MPNPLKHAHEVEVISGAYQVVLTAVVVIDQQTYRIEVLKGYAAAAAPYTARWWLQRRMSVPSPTPAASRKGERKNEDVTIWVEHHFSSPVEGKSRKVVLAQALASLVEQRSAAYA
jgi:hypothetical protein